MNFLCSFLHLVFFFPCNQEEEPEEIKEVKEEVTGRDGMGWIQMQVANIVAATRSSVPQMCVQ